MIEIRIHGRGGQGAVTASELLAIAAFKDGKFTQAFPKFGPERGGAPVEAYCRVDDKFILLRTDVYDPNYLIVLDKTLLKAVDVTKGFQKDGVVVVNTDECTKINGFETHCIDATKIALETLGRPIVNTTALGAFVAFTNVVSLKSLEAALAERFSGDILVKNIDAVRKAHDIAKKRRED
ncbi:MAG: pyruvate ferredoxin oxidoreductase subunit gamma [Candidatus Aenigmatarchaeota archaeon]